MLLFGLCVCIEWKGVGCVFAEASNAVGWKTRVCVCVCVCFGAKFKAMIGGVGYVCVGGQNAVNRAVCVSGPSMLWLEPCMCAEGWAGKLYLKGRSSVSGCLLCGN
jgi:hypothetical protein